MVTPFDPLEADFFGDLAEDTHGLWEFEFVRLHHPDLSERQVFERGRDYITRWIEAGWIQISDTQSILLRSLPCRQSLSLCSSTVQSLLATWKIHPRLTQLKISLVPANRVRQFARAQGYCCQDRSH
jgi:hypothetical protein